MEEKVKEFEEEKDKIRQQLSEENESKIKENEEKAQEEKDSLNERIKELEAQYNEKADEILKQGVEVDKIKEDLTISKENEVKLVNSND